MNKHLFNHPSNHRCVRPAAMPSIQAINRRRGVYDGISMLLVGIAPRVVFDGIWGGGK